MLRSNKQSGPYTFQQLVNLGLKPYDLVWVEGKSAAWRYPSEVDVLKSYAPSTEEQPFDRFYKKTDEQKPAQEVVTNEPVARETVTSKPVVKERKEEIPTLPVENKISPSKKVFVSMPGNGTFKKPVSVVTTTAPVAEAKPLIREEKIEQKKAEAKPVPIIEETNEPVLTQKKVVKEDPVLNEKYSESLEDIKRRYTETYLNRKKKSGWSWTSTHTSIAQVFGGAIFFCLLVVVVYKNFSGEETSLSRTTVLQPNKKDVNKTPNQTATNNTTTIPAENKIANKLNQKKQQEVKTDSKPQDEIVVAVPALEKNEETPPANDYSILVNNPEKKVEEPVEEVKPKARPVNIRKMVNVSANNYRQMAFGGVKNLELTVNNDSKFALDRVIVELQYLKPSEQPIKTERVIFNAIGAGDSKTLRIPDYLRGVKVAYRVLDIESTQYDRQTAGL